MLSFVINTHRRIMNSLERKTDENRLQQTKNETCTSSIDLELFFHCSLLPSVVIIVVLSCLEKRARRSTIDERCHLLNRRCAVLM
ncbi:Stimulated by retinoic acid gene 6 protein-like [Varanus komodoensis]|nr:Stimulated by retinoic acid gene 6 protein-like [Varanus komodoensis]